MMRRERIYARCIVCSLCLTSRVEPSGRVSFREYYCPSCGGALQITVDIQWVKRRKHCRADDDADDVDTDCDDADNDKGGADGTDKGGADDNDKAKGSVHNTR